MVERPIKKSERQTHAAPSDAVEEVVATEANSAEGSLDTSPSTKEQRTIQPVRRQDKTKGKGKGKGREPENEPLPVNRALVRGPKPKKPEPSAIAQSQEITAENASDEASEPTTADS